MSFGRNQYKKYRKQLLDAVVRKTGLDALKTATKKVAHKSAEATWEFIRNKIAYKIAKPKHVAQENAIAVEETIIPFEKRVEILNELKKVLWNRALQNILAGKLLNYIKTCDKEMDQSKWFSNWSIFSQQK